MGDGERVRCGLDKDGDMLARRKFVVQRSVVIERILIRVVVSIELRF